MRQDSGIKFQLPTCPCKYNTDKDCLGDYSRCESCSRYPFKFKDRKITKGQIIFLKTKGYNEEEISDWDFMKACREIEKYKTNFYL